MTSPRHRGTTTPRLIAVGLLCATAVSAIAEDTPPLIESADSGDWSAPGTWVGGQVPAAGDRALVRTGHRVVYDVASDEVIRGICVSGTLAFARDRDTRLNVGLLRIEAGDEYLEEGFDCLHVPDAPADGQGSPSAHGRSHEPHHEPAANLSEHGRPALEIGTPDEPIPAGVTAVVRLHYVPGMDRDSCPAILCCGGRMDLHGAPLERTWVKLPFQSARVGEARLVMPDPLPGWKEGDRILLTGTTRQSGYLGTRRMGREGDNSVLDNPASEVRTVTDLRPWGGGGLDADYQIVSLDAPLTFEHTAVDEYRAEVANLSRNVIVESADPDGVRGHTMYHANSAGSISYAEFRHLGKRGVLGRYPIHYHLVGETMRGSSVVGASIWDSHNRWVTIHGTQYLVVRDCVGYRSVGHGYFLEDGTEVFNVLDRNLAVQAAGGAPLPDQVLPYDRNLGSGFWWANSLNAFTRNVAVECDEDGFRFDVIAGDGFDPVLPVLQPDGTTQPRDVRTLPFLRFAGNEAHCQRLFGVNLGGFSLGNHDRPNSDVGGVGPDYQHPFLIQDLKVWDTHWAFHAGSPCVILDGADFQDCFYGLWRCVMHRHKYRRMTFDDVDTPVFFPRAVEDADYKYGLDDYFDLEPVDDLPPVTIVTRVESLDSERVRVHGTTVDDYAVERVLVNGRPARRAGDDESQWEIELTLPANAPATITAHAEDEVGNVERNAHTYPLRRTVTAVRAESAAAK